MPNNDGTSGFTQKNNPVDSSISIPDPTNLMTQLPVIDSTEHNVGDTQIPWWETKKRIIHMGPCRG